MGDAGEITPGLEGAVTGGAMVGCGQEVATELEEVVDLAVAGVPRGDQAGTGPTIRMTDKAGVGNAGRA